MELLSSHTTTSAVNKFTRVLRYNRTVDLMPIGWSSGWDIKRNCNKSLAYLKGKLFTNSHRGKVFLLLCHQWAITPQALEKIAGYITLFALMLLDWFSPFNLRRCCPLTDDFVYKNQTAYLHLFPFDSSLCNTKFVRLNN